MGLYIKEKNGYYQVYSGCTDQIIHDKKYITKEEALKIIIEDRLYTFLSKIIELDMSFPEQWSVNGKIFLGDKKREYINWHWETLKDDSGAEEFWLKGIEVLKKNNINLSFGTEI